MVHPSAALTQLLQRITAESRAFVVLAQCASEYVAAVHTPFDEAHGFDSPALARLAGRLLAREIRAAKLSAAPAPRELAELEARALQTLPQAVDVEVMFRDAAARGLDFEGAVARLHPHADVRVRMALRALERGLSLRGYDVDDVVADVWERLLASPPHGPGNQYEGAPDELERWRDPIGVFYVWLHRVARNRGLDMLAKRVPRTVALDAAGTERGAVDVPAPGVSQDAALQLRQTLGALTRLAASLSPSLRNMAMSLIEQPDLTHEERARELGLVPDGEAFDAHRQRYDTQRCRARAALARAAREQGLR